MISSTILRCSVIRMCGKIERHCDSRISYCRTFGEKAQSSLSKVSSKNEDPDTFGTYCEPTNQYELMAPDRLDIIDEEKWEKKMSTTYYHDAVNTKKIKELLKQRKISEALNILENGEISKPEGYVYGLLIRACGNVGYTKKAFQLYNQMKKRGIKPRPSVYTSLFNACSNSPLKKDTLERASHLLESLKDKGYEPNDINYNAMIKAFGRGGDITSAFRLADEMIDRGIAMSSSTFAFLLQACISDKEAGFRHAVMVWDKMLKNGIHPTVYTFNLLLRCCKECGCGEGIDLKNLSNNESVIQIAGINSQEQISRRKDILTLPIIMQEENLEIISSFDAEKKTEGKLTNPRDIEELNDQSSLLGKELDEITITSNKTIDRNELNYYIVDDRLHPLSPKDRLQTLGGLKGFLKQMARKRVQPNIKTFTQLLDVIPSTDAAEKELILALEKSDLEKDIEFYNMLMKKRMLRFDYEGARAVLSMMCAAGTTPNIMTFGILALGCRNKKESRKFRDEMKDAGFRMNAEILGTLIKSACARWEVFHVLELMDYCIKEEIRPNSQLLHHLNEFKVKIRNAVKEGEVGNIKDRSNKMSMTGYEIYQQRLDSWLKEVDLSEAQEIHPWKQFQRHSISRKV